MMGKTSTEKWYFDAVQPTDVLKFIDAHPRNILERILYQNGKRHGVHMQWIRTEMGNQICSTDTYVHGVLHGESCRYLNGRLVHTMLWDRGVEVSIEASKRFVERMTRPCGTGQVFGVTNL
jgi:hypothetical protein